MSRYARVRATLALLVAGSVALRVTPSSGPAQELLPGDRLRFESNGHRYVFVLERAAIPRPDPAEMLPSDSDLCGRADWALYRDGLIVDLRKTGQAPNVKAPPQK